MKTLSDYVASSRARIAIEHVGHGALMIFLHAAVADRRMWCHQLQAMSSLHHAIAYDRRGFGDTQAVEEPYSNVADLLAVMDHVVGKSVPAMLVGCSQGGAIAIDAALAAPDRIAGLILISPSVSGAPAAPPHDVIHERLNTIMLAQRANDIEHVNELKAELWLDGVLSSPGRVQGEPREMFMEMNRVASHAATIGTMLSPEPAWQQLARIAAPTYILCGDLDAPHIQNRCQHLANTIPSAEFERLPGVAHLPSLEQPALINEQLFRITQQRRYRS